LVTHQYTNIIMLEMQKYCGREFRKVQDYYYMIYHVY
jgi:hypothetical protein